MAWLVVAAGLLACCWLLRGLSSARKSAPPSVLIEAPPTGAGEPWKEVAGLSSKEAEALLDWLENHGVRARQLGPVRATGFAVRYRPLTPPAGRASP